MAGPVHAAAVAVKLPFIGASDEGAAAALSQTSRPGPRPRSPPPPPPLTFIAFSSSLSGGAGEPQQASARTLASVRDASELRLSRQVTILESLPIRATLHRGKQKTGRYFPPLSYSEGERSILDARPSPRRRRVVRRLPPPPPPPAAHSSSTLNAARQLISASSYSAASGWQRAPAVGWSWVATRVYLQALPATAVGSGGDSQESGSHGKAAHSAPTPAASDSAKLHAVKHAARSAAPQPIVVPAPDAEAHVLAGATKTLHRRLD